MYFIPNATTMAEKRRFTGQTVVLLSVAGILVLLGLMAGAEWLSARFNNPHLTTALRVYALWIGCSVAAQYFVQLMYALERIAPAIVYNLLGTQIAQICLLVAAFYFRLGLLPYLWCLVGLEAVKAAAAFIVTWRYLGGLTWRPSRETLGRQLSYSAPLAVAQAVNRLSYDIDLLIVSSTYAMREFAFYAVGAFELPLVSILRKTSATISMPRLVALYREQRVDEVLVLFREVVRKISVIALPCFVFLFMMAEPFIRVLYTAAYLPSVPIFRVYLLLIPLSCAAFNILIQTTGRTRPIMVLSLLYIVLSIPLNFMFIHWLGLIGPAIATVLCKIGLATAQLRVVTQRYQRPLHDIYPFRQVGTALMVSAMAIVPVTLATRLIPHPLAQLAAAAGLGVPVCFLVFWRCRILRDADLAPLRKWLRVPLPVKS
ncbi:MAG: hypothetical protein ETSY2_06360 [Candidatus Entotheonella gemina]|uniref:Uncharacterized protein n=1 Tax=Candidatus Entotheonella gemina TaxID=1429439 RepID=W4MEF0_9BACT|nr:MAG: hypothetical protein ETSY2_06360 [Candidatus Entotheonella gemina]